jgi:hypothetical protein
LRREHDEEIGGCGLLDVIRQERAPRLRRRLWGAGPCTSRPSPERHRTLISATRRESAARPRAHSSQTWSESTRGHRPRPLVSRDHDGDHRHEAYPEKTRTSMVATGTRFSAGTGRRHSPQSSSLSTALSSSTPLVVP